MQKQRGVEMQGPAERHREAEWAVPHPQVVGKNWEGYLTVRDPSPTPDHPAQGSSAKKISPHSFWL